MCKSVSDRIEYIPYNIDISTALDQKVLLRIVATKQEKRKMRVQTGSSRPSHCDTRFRRADFHQRFGYTLAFVATRSGLTRWQDFLVDETEVPSEPPPDHFSRMHPRAIDEIWYKRAVEQHYVQPESFVFSIPIDEDGATNSTLVTASRAIFIGPCASVQKTKTKEKLWLYPTSPNPTIAVTQLLPRSIHSTYIYLLTLYLSCLFAPKVLAFLTACPYFHHLLSLEHCQSRDSFRRRDPFPTADNSSK
jgi:hypothetical protein